MVSRITNLWLHAVTTYPKVVLLLIALLLLAAAAGLPRFKLDASADSLTLENDKDLTYFRDVSERYSSGDSLVVTFTPEGDLFSDESLALLRELQDDLARIEGIASINSILNVPLLYSPKQSLREVANEPRTLETAGVDREQAKQEFLSSPIYRELILSPDGRTTALQLNIGLDKRYLELVQKRDALREKRDERSLSEQERQNLARVSEAFLQYRTASEARSHRRVEEVRNVVEAYQDRAQIFVGGVTMITADMVGFIKKDLMVFGSASVLFMFLVLAVIFRSFKFVVIPMATCLSAVLLMLGLLSWLDWRLTVISSNFVPLLLIISLAIIIHLVVRYREYAQENPSWDQKALVTETVRFMAKPCVFTALTTIVAFASLVVSDIRPVIDFGWMMTIGLVVALILAFCLLPASLMLLPREQPSDIAGKAGRQRLPLTAYCAFAVERHGRWVLLVSAMVAILSAWGISRLQVENRFIDYFHEDTEIHQGLKVIDDKLGGTTTLEIIIGAPAVASLSEEDASSGFAEEDDPFAEADTSNEDDAFAVPASEVEEDPFAVPDSEAEEDPFADTDSPSEGGGQVSSVWMSTGGLETLESIHDYLESLPEVGKVQSLAILYKVGKDINSSLNNFELAIMERSLSDEVRETLVAPYLHGPTETRITMRIKDSHPGLQRSELVERIRQHLDEELALDMEHVRFSGLLVLYNNMLQSLFKSQIVTLGVVFLGIFMMFIILFRSLIVASVAIVPNIIAALAIIGFMGVTGIPLDMMTITIAAITVGIGVDNTIHYIYRFKTEIGKDGDYLAAMHRSHRSIGRAMYYTSIIIIFGFMIMVLSSFIPTVYFGLLTGLAMLIALAGALFLLPKLILMIKPFKLAQNVEDEA